MIQKVVVTNRLGQSVELELSRPGDSGLAVLGIDGLGPARGVVNIAENAAFHGGFYTGSRASKRNIVFRLHYYQDAEASRLLTYKYFPLTEYVHLKIWSETRCVETYGYVETNEASIFEQRSGCVISVLCPDAWLYDVIQGMTGFGAVTGAFEFPMEVPDPPGEIEVGVLSLATQQSIIYPGETEVGFVIYIKVTGSATYPVITNSVTLEQLTIDTNEIQALTGFGLIGNEEIWISSVKGDKYATLKRGAFTYNILNALGKNPPWFTLNPGDNLYAYSALTGVANLQFEFQYRVAYAGV